MTMIMQGPPRACTIINGREVDYFSGCGFFDLQGHPEVIEAACRATRQYGIASGTSRHSFGTTPVMLELEETARLFFGTEDIFYYVSGCFGSSILLQGLVGYYDIVFVDEESHYSSFNAISLIQHPVIDFKHRDPGDLKKKLELVLKPGQHPLVLCDGIFPISGKISPIADYKAILESFAPGFLCVDDAYATGVIGDKGRGSFEYFSMEGEGGFSCGTMSKAMGGHGGVIAGSKEFIDMLKRKSSFANACAPTPLPAMAATTEAMKILMKNPGMRRQLHENTHYAKTGLRHLGFVIDDSPVPTICLTSQGGVDVAFLQRQLMNRGIATTFISGGGYTSVPVGGALRVSIFSTHSRAQIDRLISEIKSLV